VDWRVANLVNIKKYRIISSMHYPPKARVKDSENKPEISSFIL